MIKVTDIDSLPKDPDILLDIIRKVVSENDKLNQENSWFREVIAARNRRLFGRKSEKLDHDELQAWLFNEAEIGATIKKPGKDETETITYTRKKRKRGRKPISDKLPREIIKHEVSETETVCSCCSKERPQMKPEISEEVEFIPAKVIVHQHIYQKYGPCKCKESKGRGIKPIIRAKREKRIIPGCMAAPSLLSFLATSKFCDGLPYYRVAEMLSRYGIHYNRATMCNQMIGLARGLQPLLDLMWEDLLVGEVIRMDETRVQVIDEPGRKADQISWMHVASGNYKEKQILIFHYHMSRKGDIPKNILKDWNGYLQTDGLAAYNHVGEQPGIIHVGCWAHARRKYIDARGGPKAPPGGLADEALSFIKVIFKTEEDLRDKELSANEFVKRRRDIIEPILSKFKKWLYDNTSQVPPRTMLSEAINYTYNHWEKLIKYLEHPELRPDNNIVERYIKHFVIGRKNWLFSYSPLGAHASAALYSLIQSAHINGLNEYEYMKYIITVLPNTLPESLQNLLPHRIDPKLFENLPTH